MKLANTIWTFKTFDFDTVWTAVVDGKIGDLE